MHTYYKYRKNISRPGFFKKNIGSPGIAKAYNYSRFISSHVQLMHDKLRVESLKKKNGLA